MFNISSVHSAGYLNEETIFANVQFDDKTNPDGTPVYTPLMLADDDYGPDAQMLSAIRAMHPITAPYFVLDAARRKKRAEINRWRDEQESGSYLFEYDGHKWDYGKATQDRMSISLAMAKRGALPAGFAWTDGDNNIVPMDDAGLIALAAAIEQAMFEKGMQINQRQLQMKAEVEALTRPEDIRRYRVDWQ
ncbi:DUF4376 domain-containing protein [Salmonella enterica]|uniref:DUF4376 domain-containing protein n=1 Tax=Salmonella enterica TaxID=28901 RepID=UPI0012D5E375|nr:DUF4376 domain-containing protein [Salmonella enterica]EBQ9005071.1 DUF4376 domain-containing protein [Salmonella enterica subsp. enterica serovar Blockley]ECU7995138.1 DUF4376 domain-containing protein [Salmonella enterica subsp. enterica serovar Toucra]ECW2124480.1 DUF4376 domain-containing protein [Salmonella enterica]